MVFCLVNFDLLQRGSSSRENVGRSSLSQGNQTAATAAPAAPAAAPAAAAVNEDQTPANTSSSAETARFLAAFTIFCFSLF